MSSKLHGILVPLIKNACKLQLDSNVVIDLILATQKVTGQFTDILGGTVIPIIEDL
jgi:hypothetical protein